MLYPPSNSTSARIPKTDRKAGVLYTLNPPFISVHSGLGDLSWWCHKGVRCATFCQPYPYTRNESPTSGSSFLGVWGGESDGYGSPSRYGRISRHPVGSFLGDPNVPVYAPDECEAFQAEVEELGWCRVDHPFFKSEVGETDLVDAAVLSLRSGSVGTGLSTYSLTAMRSVEACAGNGKDG